MKLTNNFTLAEFASRDGKETPPHIKANLAVLAFNLQALRDHIGKPIIVNSGYRSPEHNKDIGGAENSFHMKGMAADIRVEGVSPLFLQKIILKLIEEGKMKEGGVGLYASFVHYDTRGYLARWEG